MQDVLDFTATNLNGLEASELQTHAGLTFLIAGPGEGKSTWLSTFQLAQESFERYQRGQDVKSNSAWHLHLSVRHGAVREAGKKRPTGQLTFPALDGGEAGFDLWESGKVVQKQALPAVHFLPGLAFAQLTRSAKKSPDTAAKEELDAFGTLTRLQATPEALSPEGFVGLVQNVQPGLLPGVVEGVSTAFNRAALFLEVESKEKTLELKAVKHREDKEAATAGVESVAAESAQLQKLEGEASTVRIDRRGRISEEKAKEEHRALHIDARPDPRAIETAAMVAGGKLKVAIEMAAGGLPDEPDVKGAQTDIDRCKGATQDWKDSEEQQRGVLREEEKALENLRAKLDYTTEKREASEDSLEHTYKLQAAVKENHAAWAIKQAQHEERATRIETLRESSDEAQMAALKITDACQNWDARQAIIDRKVEGPTEEGVAKAEKAVEAQRVIVETARRKEAELARKDEQHQLTGELEELNKKGSAYRVAAGEGLQKRIAQVLTDGGIEGWSIVGGELYCINEKTGKLAALRSLSDSMRDTAVLKLMIERAQIPEDKTPVLALPSQSILEGMNTRQRKALAAYAKEQGIHVVGAVHDDAEGPLRVEYL